MNGEIKPNKRWLAWSTYLTCLPEYFKLINTPLETFVSKFMKVSRKVSLRLRGVWRRGHYASVGLLPTEPQSLYLPTIPANLEDNFGLDLIL